MKTGIIFDNETTGLVKPAASNISMQPKIIEFAGIKIDEEGNELGRLEFICDPQQPLEEIIKKITGFKDEDLKGKPTFREKIDELTDFFFGVDYCVAHNCSFDISCLYYELLRNDRVTRFPWPPQQICTVEATMHLKGHRLKLGDLHVMATGQDIKNAHRAMADVEALKTVWFWLKQEKHV